MVVWAQPGAMYRSVRVAAFGADWPRSLGVVIGIYELQQYRGLLYPLDMRALLLVLSVLCGCATGPRYRVRVNGYASSREWAGSTFWVRPMETNVSVLQ